MRFVISVAMGLVLLVFGSSAQTDEHKIPLSEVPKAAIDAVKARFPGADLKGAGKEVEGDETTYEISLINAGKHVSVNVGDEGEIGEIETEIARTPCPGP